MPYIRRTYHVDALGLFGSYPRGDQTEKSDLDVLVTFTETPDLYEFVGLAQYLEDLLGIKVDLSMREALKRYIAPYVLREVEYV